MRITRLYPGQGAIKAMAGFDSKPLKRSKPPPGERHPAPGLPCPPAGQYNQATISKPRGPAVNRRLSTASLSLLLCLCLSAPALAGPVLSRVLENGVLRVGLSPDNPPLSFVSREGKIMGYEVDLAALVAAGLGVRLSIESMPFNQIQAALLVGKLDLAISAVTMTPQRNTKLMMVGPYLLAGQSILTTKALIMRLQEEEDNERSELVMAATRGTTSADAAREIFPHARLVEYEDQQQGLKALLGGQVQALVAEHSFCVLAALRYRDQGLTTLDKPLTMEPLGVAFVEDALLANWLSNFLHTLSATGRLEALSRHWFKDASWLTHLPEDKLL